MMVWLLVLHGTVKLPTVFAPVTWHYHELLFGFVAATIAGFLLTAIPNWTGRMPLQGWPLAALVFLWLAGRIAIAFSAWTGPALAAAMDLSFLIVFTVVVAREILAGRNWRNLPVLAALSLMIAANVLIHADTFGRPIVGDAGRRLALSIVIMLISMIGGRIIPSFTANWLRKRHAKSLPVPFGLFDHVALAISAVSLLVWVVADLTVITGIALILAAVAQAIRLIRWRGVSTFSEPLLWILHLGYAWLPLGFSLLGLAVWIPSFATGAIHAFTTGAIGTMTLAVMTRASLGHSKRELMAGYSTTAIYILILFAGVSRVVAPALEHYTSALAVAGLAWVAAFGLFTATYLPLFVRR
jgi:uncharacterized protein involved in response to NO